MLHSMVNLPKMKQKQVDAIECLLEVLTDPERGFTPQAAQKYGEMLQRGEHISNHRDLEGALIKWAQDQRWTVDEIEWVRRRIFTHYQS